MTRKRWSKEELELLCKLKEQGVANVSEEFQKVYPGRTVNSINIMLSTMQLTKKYLRLSKEDKEWLKSMDGWCLDDIFTEVRKRKPFIKKRNLLKMLKRLCVNYIIKEKGLAFGTETALKSGIVRVKVNKAGFQWVSKDRLVWNETHPEDMASDSDAFIHLDGDMYNFAPENLMKVGMYDKSVWRRCFKQEGLPPELVRLTVLQAQLRRAVRHLKEGKNGKD